MLWFAGARAQVPVWDVRMDPALYDTLYQRDLFSDVYLPTQSVAIRDSLRTDAQIRFKGHSTRYFPKKPFRLKFASDFEKIRQINLNPLYTDRSSLREKLAWDLYADIGALAPRASHAQLRINDRYQGLYLQVDKIDKYFLKLRGRTSTSPMYSASDLYPFADLTVQPDSLLKLYYDKEIGDPNDYADLTALISALNAADSASFPAVMDGLFDSRTVLQWFAVNTLVMSGDSYCKNYYLLFDTTRSPRKWSIIPWDYDLSWGRNGEPSMPYPAQLLNDGFASTFPPLSGPSSVLKDGWKRSPVLMERLRLYLDTLLATVWTDDRLSRRIDSLAAIVDPFVRMEPGAWGSYQDFLDHVDALKYYVTARRNYLLTAFVHPAGGEFDMMTLVPHQLNVPYHAVGVDGWQIASVWFTSMSGLDSLLVRVYYDSLPPGLDGKRVDVHRWLELTPFPPGAKFTATIRWAYSDYSLDTREVSAGVQDEHLLRSFWFDGAGYRALASRVNGHGNFAVVDDVTDACSGPGRHLALLVSETYAQKWTRLPLPAYWHRWFAADRSGQTAIGIAGDEGLFLSSTDGGASWTEGFTGQSTSLYGLSKGPDWISCGVAGSVFRSLDGVAWTRVPVPTRKDLYAAAGMGRMRWLAGDGVILRSTDGGTSWTRCPVDSTIAYRAVRPLSSSRLFAAAGKGRVLLSTDAGSTWTIVQAAGGMALNAAASVSDRYCWVAGDSGAVLFSSDSGATWARTSSPSAFSIKAIWPEDDQRVFVAGEKGGMYYSTNRGTTWASQYTADSHDLQAMLFTDPSHGIAVGSGGAVLMTSSPGTTTSVMVAGTAVPERFGLDQNYPNPFNSSTLIVYQVSGVRRQGSGDSEVKLAVYDLLGREVGVLVNEQKAVGSYTVQFDAGSLASGVYLYRLTAGGRAITKKMMVLK